MTRIFVKIFVTAFTIITLSNIITVADENLLNKDDLEMIKKLAYYGFPEPVCETNQNNENPTIILKRNSLPNKKDNKLPRNSVVEIENNFQENHFKDVPYTKDYNSFYGYDNKHTIVHYVGWRYTDILNECNHRRKIIGAVLVSPVTRYCPNNDSWDERYNVLNYEIDNPSGTEEEFKNMVKKCNKYGIRVIVDVVLNNMASDKLKDCPVQSKNYPETECLLCGEKHQLYDSSDFNASCEINPEDYKYNAYKVRNCELKGRHDLIIRNKNKEINTKIIMFLTKLIGMGVAGFRIIAASHMDPDELNELYSLLPPLRVDFEFPPRSRPFIINDVFDPFQDKTWAIQVQDYLKKGRVMDYKYALKLTEIFENPKMNLMKLYNRDDFNFVPKDSAVVFLYNDSLIAIKGGLDGQPSINSEYIFDIKSFSSDNNDYIKKAHIYMAAAFMFSQRHEAILLTSTTKYLADGKGIPLINNKVRSALINYAFDLDGESYYFHSDFMTEHRTFERLMQFHQYIMADDKVSSALPNDKRNEFYKINDDPNKIAYCVGTKGFIIINNSDSIIDNARITSCFHEPGKYCDIITGYLGYLRNFKKCTGTEVEVKSNGQMLITLQPHSTLVLQGDIYH